MLDDGLVHGTGGNFSVRCERGFIITPSGMDYRKLAPADLPLVSLDGRQLEGERRPSVESGLHREIYKRRPGICAVVHTHSLCASAASALRRPLPALLDNQALLFGKEIPCAEYAHIGTAELAKNAAEALGEGSSVLLANHGSVCVAATLPVAAELAEMLEYFAKVYFMTQSAGGGIALTEKETAEGRQLVKESYGQR